MSFTEVVLPWIAVTLALIAGTTSALFGHRYAKKLLFGHGTLLFAVPTYCLLLINLNRTLITQDGWCLEMHH